MSEINKKSAELPFLDYTRNTGVKQEKDHKNPTKEDLQYRTEHKETEAWYTLCDIVENVFMKHGYERQGVSFYKRTNKYIRIIRPYSIHLEDKTEVYYMPAQIAQLDIDYYTAHNIPVGQFPDLMYFSKKVFYPSKELLKEWGCAHKSARSVGFGTKTVSVICNKEWFLENADWLIYWADQLLWKVEELSPFQNSHPEKGEDKYKKLIQQGKDVYLKTLENLNWFTETTITKEEAKDYIEQHQDNPELFVYALGEYWMDCEGAFDTPKGYIELIKDLLKIAGVVIKYLEVSDQDEIVLTTEKNKHSYQLSGIGSSDWIEEDFIEDFVNNEILVKENVIQRFYKIPPMDQSLQWMFLTPTTYQQAIETGITTDDMEYFNDNNRLPMF